VFTTHFTATYNFNAPDNDAGWEIARFQTDFIPRILICWRHARIDIEALTVSREQTFSPSSQSRVFQLR
jgi:hypothetical protein